MPVFAVRSVDEQLGIVAARNKVDAVERLDEFANFEGCPIRELPELMLLLDMDDEGAFTLEHIGARRWTTRFARVRLRARPEGVRWRAGPAGGRTAGPDRPE